MSKKYPQLNKSATVAELPAACSSESAAVAWFEAKRWGDTPCCPACGDINVYQMKDRKTGERNRDYRWRCRGCGKLYSVRTGTVFAETLIPMRKWAMALWECGAAKNGVSALELSRKLQINYRSGLFMLSRLRYCMATDTTDPKLSGTLEADETFWGGRPRYPRKGITGNIPGKPKPAVFAVLSRGGQVRTKVLTSVTAENLRTALMENAETSSRLVTDDLNLYWAAGRPFARHDKVKHSQKEYVNRDDPSINSNSIESFFARLKRGLHGVYHNVSREHLHRYCSQYQFLFNTRGLCDGQRIEALLRRTEGKRLFLRDPSRAA